MPHLKCLFQFPISMRKCASNPLLLLLLLLFFSAPVMGQNKEALQKQRDEINRQIKITSQLINETEENRRNTQSQLNLTSSKVELRKKLISNITQEIHELNANISENQKQIETLQADLERLKEEYGEMIYKAYVNRNSYDKILFIFSSDDFFQALKRTRYINQYSEYRARQAERILQTTEKLEDTQVELENQIAEKTTLLENEQSEQQELAGDLRKQESILSKLQNETRSLKKKLKQQEKERNKLNKEIQRIIEAEIAAAKKDNAGTFELTPEAAALSANFESNKGKLPWPVERGVITGSFGKHAHPVLPGITIENNGIDITTGKGETVRSVFEGTVTSVFTIPGAGKNIIISHGAYRTVYTNLREVFVTTGEDVSTKQALGILDTDEDEGKTIAHLEIWKISGSGTTKQNPALWIFK